MTDFYWNAETGYLNANVISVNTFDVENISTTGSVSINNAIQTFSGTSGALYYDVPFNGNSYKKVVFYADDFSNTSQINITLPTFKFLPAVISNVSGLKGTYTTTLFTVNTNSTAINGFTILEGY